MLLVLKIPLVYLAVVVWWAIREPRPEEPFIPPGPEPFRSSPAPAAR